MLLKTPGISYSRYPVSIQNLIERRICYIVSLVIVVNIGTLFLRQELPVLPHRKRPFHQFLRLLYT